MPRIVCVVGLLLAAVGCTERRDYVPVSGRVTLDGKPMAGGGVAFEPVAPEGKRDSLAFGSYGATDADGRFTLVGLKGDRGAAVGPHRVAIRKPKKPGSAAEGGELLPAKYNVDTELTFVVPPTGTDQANFDLILK
jgi:hypothetical protein